MTGPEAAGIALRLHDRLLMMPDTSTQGMQPETAIERKRMADRFTRRQGVWDGAAGCDRGDSGFDIGSHS
jgi:hypothetical protein